MLGHALINSICAFGVVGYSEVSIFASRAANWALATLCNLWRLLQLLVQVNLGWTLAINQLKPVNVKGTVVLEELLRAFARRGIRILLQVISSVELSFHVIHVRCR